MKNLIFVSFLLLGITLTNGCGSKSSNSDPIGKTEAPDSPILEKAPTEEENSAVDCTCTHDRETYAKGAIICVNKIELKCGCSGWFKTGNGC